MELMSIGYASMIHYIMLLHACVNVSLYIDLYCKGRLTKYLGLHCDFGYKSCVCSIKLHITIAFT